MLQSSYFQEVIPFAGAARNKLSMEETNELFAENGFKVIQTYKRRMYIVSSFYRRF